MSEEQMCPAFCCTESWASSQSWRTHIRTTWANKLWPIHTLVWICLDWRKTNNICYLEQCSSQESQLHG